MSHFKDHFSTQSAGYSKFRPDYPKTMYQYLSDTAQGHDMLWDCATGTGQAARGLSSHFTDVVATDASEKQVAEAIGPDNVYFRVATAENSGLAPASVDLVTVAQALHWFAGEGFYREVKRVLKKNGIIAVWSYNLLRIEEGIDQLVNHFSDEFLASYWPPERQLVRDNYQTIAFPFHGVVVPDFHMTANWSRDDLMGYLATWSSVVRFKTAHGHDPLDEIRDELVELWPDASDYKKITWPLIVRLGRV